MQPDHFRAPARHHLVDRRGQAPEITAVINEARITPLLRRHEVGGAQDGTRHRHSVIIRLGFGQTKICELGQAVQVQEDVGRLDVAVDDSRIVGFGKAVAELAGKIHYHI